MQDTSIKRRRGKMNGGMVPKLHSPSTRIAADGKADGKRASKCVGCCVFCFAFCIEREDTFPVPFGAN